MDKYIDAIKAFWDAFKEPFAKFMATLSAEDSELFGFISQFIGDTIDSAAKD